MNDLSTRRLEEFMSSAELHAALDRRAHLIIDWEGDVEWHEGSTADRVTHAMRSKVVTRDDTRRKARRLSRTLYVPELWTSHGVEFIVLVEGPPAPRAEA